MKHTGLNWPWTIAGLVVISRRTQVPWLTGSFLFTLLFLLRFPAESSFHLISLPSTRATPFPWHHVTVFVTKHFLAFCFMDNQIDSMRFDSILSILSLHFHCFLLLSIENLFNCALTFSLPSGSRILCSIPDLNLHQYLLWDERAPSSMAKYWCTRVPMRSNLLLNLSYSHLFLFFFLYPGSAAENLWNKLVKVDLCSPFRIISEFHCRISFSFVSGHAECVYDHFLFHIGWFLRIVDTSNPSTLFCCRNSGWRIKRGSGIRYSYLCLHCFPCLSLPCLLLHWFLTSFSNHIQSNRV